MENIAKRLNAYIATHPFNSGDSDCETVLEQLYQAYAESHESDPPEIRNGFKELEEFLCTLPTMPSSTSVVASAAPMNARHLSMVSNTELI